MKHIQSGSMLHVSKGWQLEYIADTLIHFQSKHKAATVLHPQRMLTG